MRLDGPPEPIKREDLRSECLACGGSGRNMKPSEITERGVKTYLGACGRCAGSGKVYPRKVYQ